MTLLVEQSDSRAWTDEQMEVLFAEGFPKFITADLDSVQVPRRLHTLEEDGAWQRANPDRSDTRLS